MKLIKKFVLVLLTLHNFELAKQSAINTTLRTAISLNQPINITRQSTKPNGKEYHDDTRMSVEEVETIRLLPLIQIPMMRNLTRKIANETVADPDLVQYISECQAIVVALRQSYVDILQGHAEWTAQWYEFHFPDYYACVTRHLIRLMRSSMSEYPKKVIMKLRTVKDAVVRSYITNEPISKVDEEVFEGLNTLIENMANVLKVHRDGDEHMMDSVAQLGGLEGMLERQVRQHEKVLRERCAIPLSDGHSPLRDSNVTDYHGEEHYDTIDYFLILNES